jgi:hypothetical protein
LIEELLTEPDALRRSYVLAIGSEPTDELAMSLAAMLLRRARAQSLRAVCVSMRKSPDEAALSSDPDVAILHNLPHDCHQMRAQFCRDWLDWLDDSFRIVVIAGSCPYRFSHKRLAYPIDGGIYLCGELREDIQH